MQHDTREGIARLSRDPRLPPPRWLVALLQKNSVTSETPVTKAAAVAKPDVTLKWLQASV